MTPKQLAKFVGEEEEEEDAGTPAAGVEASLPLAPLTTTQESQGQPTPLAPAREEWERTKANPLRLESESELGPPPSVDIASLKQKYEASFGIRTTFRNGYLQTPEGRLATIEIRKEVIGCRDQVFVVREVVRTQSDAAQKLAENFCPILGRKSVKLVE